MAGEKTRGAPRRQAKKPSAKAKAKLAKKQAALLGGTVLSRPEPRPLIPPGPGETSA